MKKLFRNKYFLVLLLLFVIFLPTSITQDAESELDAIVTAVGIDKVDEGVEVSLQVIVPTPSAQYSQQLSVVSSKANSVGEGMSNLSLRLGKKIAFPHCKVICFNDALAVQGLPEALDFLVRNKANGDDMVLLGVKDSAKDMLNSISDIDNSLYFGLSNSGSYNKEYTKGKQIDMGSFYKKYLSEESSLIIGSVSLESASEVGMVAIPSGQGSSQAPNDTSKEEEQKTVVNRGESMLFKEGKKIRDLSSEDTMSFNWFDVDSNRGYIEIKNVNDDLYKNATVGVEIDQKKTKVQTYFEGDTPVYKLQLDLYIKVSQITENDKNLQRYKEDKAFLTPTLKQMLIERISSDIDNAISIAKENNTDIMLASKTINKFNHKKFEEYKSKSNDNLLSGIKFEKVINIKEKL